MVDKNRLLIVDDDVDLRDLLRSLFEEEGYLVATAPEGASALRALREEPAPSVIVLDLQMPVMSGAELLEVLAVDPRLAAIPVVVLSSASQELPRGARFLLHKPTDFEALRQIVLQLVAQERRAHPRYPARLNVAVHHSDKAHTLTSSLNLSRGGILLHLDWPPRVGEALHLSVTLPDANRIQVDGEVRHVRRAPDGYHVGARFEPLQVDYESAIAAALSRLGASA